MRFSVFQVSRKGARETNEDCVGYCYTSAAVLLVLADGMGGHPEGEVAAQLAARTIAVLFQKQALPALADVRGFLEQAVMAAHRQILRYASGKAMPDSPRTTIVVAVIQSGCVSWTHSGDSRLYLVRNATLLLRTKDHSLVEQSLSRGPVGDASEQPNRNVLFTCLGSPTSPVFSVAGPVPLQQADRLMLCSDGLWSVIPEAELVAALGRRPIDAAVPDLVEEALRQGGETSDNVTCLALAWETPDDFEPTRGGVATDFIPDRLLDAGPQAGLEELDDAAIERSIAEINATIRRGAQK